MESEFILLSAPSIIVCIYEQLQQIVRVATCKDGIQFALKGGFMSGAVPFSVD